MLVRNSFVLHVFPLSFHKILYTLSASSFEISSRLLIFNSKRKQVLTLHGPVLSSHKIFHSQMKSWLGRSDKKSRIHPAPRSALRLEKGGWVKDLEFCFFWNATVILQSISVGFCSGFFSCITNLSKWRELHGSGFMHPVSSPALLFLSQAHAKSMTNSTVHEAALQAKCTWSTTFSCRQEGTQG